MSEGSQFLPKGNIKSEAGDWAAAGLEARASGVASGSGVWVPSSGVASFKTNKGEGAEAGKPEMRKSIVIKEREREREINKLESGCALFNELLGFTKYSSSDCWPNNEEGK